MSAFDQTTKLHLNKLTRESDSHTHKHTQSPKREHTVQVMFPYFSFLISVTKMITECFSVYVKLHGTGDLYWLLLKGT